MEKDRKVVPIRKDIVEDSGEWIVCKEYTNRWGQLMVASDYGYPYWRFRVGRNKKG